MTSAQRRQREKAKRRQDIIDAAESLFFMRGYDSVSMDDIAAKIELNKATLYLYFENKEALFYTIVLRGLQKLNGLMSEMVEREATGIDKIWGAWQAFLEFARRYPDHLNAYIYFQSGRFGLDRMMYADTVGTIPPLNFNTPVVYNIPNGQLVEEILDIHRTIFDTLCSAVKRGIEEGGVREDVDPAEASAVMMILAEGALKMNPLMWNDLGQRGINKQRFLKDVHQYLNLARDLPR